MELSMEKQAIIEATERGYSIDDLGIVTSYKGVKLSLFPNKKGYLEFAYRMLNGHKKNIKVHQFQAYRKYGMVYCISDAVGHKNLVRFDNSIDNIILLTNKQVSSPERDLSNIASMINEQTNQGILDSIKNTETEWLIWLKKFIEKRKKPN